MVFEVIPGGLCLQDDIPAPDKPIEEWTQEEHEQYHRYLYENAEPGTAEAAVKSLDISSSALQTVIITLEAIQAACEQQVNTSGYRNEWPYLECSYLLTMLKLKSEISNVSATR